jgi:hypothetical protein
LVGSVLLMYLVVCVVFLFRLSSSCFLVYTLLSASLDFPFLIAPLVLSHFI